VLPGELQSGSTSARAKSCLRASSRGASRRAWPRGAPVGDLGGGVTQSRCGDLRQHALKCLRHRPSRSTATGCRGAGGTQGFRWVGSPGSSTVPLPLLGVAQAGDPWDVRVMRWCSGSTPQSPVSRGKGASSSRSWRLPRALSAAPAARPRGVEGAAVARPWPPLGAKRDRGHPRESVRWRPGGDGLKAFDKRKGVASGLEGRSALGPGRGRGGGGGSAR
jgi:hypothetical protein